MFASAYWLVDVGWVLVWFWALVGFALFLGFLLGGLSLVKLRFEVVYCCYCVVLQLLFVACWFLGGLLIVLILSFFFVCIYMCLCFVVCSWLLCCDAW